MVRFACIWAVVAASACGGEQAWTWPDDVKYDGQVRSAKWLESAHEKLANRIVLAGGKYYHLDDPGRAKGTGREWDKHALAKFIKPLDGDLVYCQLESKEGAIARLMEHAELEPDALLVLARADAKESKPEDPQWLAYPAERPITRPQLVEAIRGGLQLSWVRPCSVCNGRGWNLAPGRKGRGPLRERCQACGGTGEVPKLTIRR